MSAVPEKDVRKVAFHSKYDIKKVNGYGTIKPKIGLILTEIFSSSSEKEISMSIPYVIVSARKHFFMMSRLYGYDKKYAIIDSKEEIEVILENGKWKRKIPIKEDSYFVFGIATLR